MNPENTSKIDLINIILILVSFIIAYLFPLELFVFSFIVLGPLHYLTEISWLEKRNFFVQGRFDYFFLIALCVTIAVLQFFKFPFSRTLPLAIALGSIIAFFFLQKTAYKVIVILGICGLTFFYKENHLFISFFGVFLPTLIHVFIFTGLFILYGALKNRSTLGYLSLAVFVSCSLCYFVYNPSLFGVGEGEFLRSRSQEGISLSLSSILGISDFVSGSNIYTSEVGRPLFRFVAFTYTYHYLNWFSKTSIIQWHQVSITRLAAVIVLWVFFVFFHKIDFRAGLFLLAMLSIGHVLLELPLNYKSIVGIIQELRRRVVSITT